MPSSGPESRSADDLGGLFERVAVRVKHPRRQGPRTPPTTACDVTSNLTNATRTDHRWSVPGSPNSLVFLANLLVIERLFE